MITGAHVMVFSRDADADRAFLRDVLGFDSVDAGGGWLIFRLPPAEVAVHPTDGETRHELSLMCDDIAATSDDLRRRGFDVGAAQDQGWGISTTIRLPGGLDLLLYEPRHPTAI